MRAFMTEKRMKIEAGLGMRIRSLRKGRGMTLADLGERTGFSASAISKMENEQLALTYDKLVNIASAFEMDIGGLLSEGSTPPGQPIGRRSIARKGDGREVQTGPYTYLYVSPELSRKQLTPNVSRLHAHSMEEFGAMLRHGGEEWIYVLAGEVEVHTEFYEPERLSPGDSIYIDSRMAHAYISVSREDAQIISVCTVPADEANGTVRPHI